MAAATGVTAVVAGFAVSALSFYAFAPKAALVSCVLGWAMLAIAAIDAQRFTIPDPLSLPAIPFGLLASRYVLDPFSSQLLSLHHAIGACLGGASFWLVRARQAGRAEGGELAKDLDEQLQRERLDADQLRKCTGLAAP